MANLPMIMSFIIESKQKTVEMFDTNLENPLPSCSPAAVPRWYDVS